MLHEVLVQLYRESTKKPSTTTFESPPKCTGGVLGGGKGGGLLEAEDGTRIRRTGCFAVRRCFVCLILMLQKEKSSFPERFQYLSDCPPDALFFYAPSERESRRALG
ncbi:unnamed protein product, partial [Ectocarpus sp. 12 AP-2014]